MLFSVENICLNITKIYTYLYLNFLASNVLNAFNLMNKMRIILKKMRKLTYNEIIKNDSEKKAL